MADGFLLSINLRKTGTSYRVALSDNDRNGRWENVSLRDGEQLITTLQNLMDHYKQINETSDVPYADA